ncbi:hypothetical protein MIMGU_mgv1a004431mg [Erythranthe guttata]|uniref:Uncharacterized protein n=1 Tax=Erythranthe guttata TaxID=4155 RepID=A0A022QBF4_ERYGU|nr:hypothetical protein MIMGU_mgv1a004431mg [Erythranthe guttata]
MMNNPPNNSIDAKHLISRRISRPYDYLRGGMSHLLRLFTVISGAGETPVIVQIQHDGEAKQFSFEEIVSTVVWIIVKEAREPAAAAAGFTAGNDVVVLEDFMNDSQRQAVVNAAKSAGIDAAALRFVNNPVCAALAYNLDTEASENGENGETQLNVLVYNHGGDDLSVSLFSIEEGGVFRMRAAARNANFAGEEFTNRLLDHLMEKFNRKHNKDLTTATASLRRLREACERAKRVLSSETRTTIEIDSLYEGIDFYCSISRDVFVILTIDLLVRSMNAAITDKSHVHEVVLIGGTSKIPKLQQLLQDFFDGKYLRMSIDPYLAVSQRVASVRVGFLDFTRMDIGIETGDAGLITVLIPKNTTIPATKERILFRTDSNSQSTMKIHVFRGVIKEILIPPAPRGVVQFKLRIKIDVYGTLSVWISDRIVMEMKNYSTFLKRRSDAMLTDVKKKLAAKRALLEYAYSMRHACHSDEDHPSSELEKIEIDINEVINWVNANPLVEVDAYEDKLDELKAACFLLNPHIWRWS